MKQLVRILLISLAIALSGCKHNPTPAPAEEPFNGPEYQDAAPMVKDGDVVLATNRNVEKFLTEVTYEDKDWSSTKIYDYYGGFNRVKYNEEGIPDENGKVVKSPKSDKPESYSIRWKKKEDAGALTLSLEEPTLKQVKSVKAGACYVVITNLVPNTTYTYKVTYDDSGEVAAEGSFSTTGHLHQVFFNNACRNGRDLGGWKTLDGKTVKYHKIYRGGRMSSTETVDVIGAEEILSEGIGAQLDLRGKDDVLSAPAVSGLDFCAPVIEQGGTAMLTDINDEGVNKTKQCFDFVLNSVRAGKGVYFHCSLGRDRTGTLAVLLLGLLGVPEHDISKEYEVTYFAPLGYSCSSSEKSSYDKDKGGWLFQNNRTKWVYSEVAPYFWKMAGEGGTFAQGVEKYLTTVAGVPQADIDEFRNLMLE